MMFSSLLTKTLYDKRFFILGWSLGLAFLGYLMVIFYPAFNQDNALDQLVASMPPALQGLVGDLGNLKEISTYLASQLFDIRMPIFVSVLAILLTVSLTVGEEEKGLLKTLTAMPASRTKVLFTKWFAIVIILVVSTIATVFGVLLGLWQINEQLDAWVLVRLCAVMLLFMVALATLIFAIGMATGKRALTTGAGIIVAVGSFILTTFATSVEWLKPYEVVSLLHYFPATDIAKGTVDASNLIVYAAIIAVSLVSAFILFRRRDIG